jgi:hypothetical protein
MRRLLPLLLLAACHHAPDQPGGLTADDQRQLNDAAAALDANAITPDQPANESQAP